MGKAASLKASKSALVPAAIDSLPKGGVQKTSSSKLTKGGGSSAAHKVKEKPLRGRVWWPPTRERDRTEFAGAYWPVRLVKKSSDEYQVTYDNGEVELVDQEHVFLDEPPVAFGEEKLPIQAGEYVEVHNGSTTDPCAWLAKIVRVDKLGHHWIEFPFHDPDVPRKARSELLRRARVLDHGTWRLLQPKQAWDDGEVTSPLEMYTIEEAQLGDYVSLPRTAAG